MKSDNLFSFVYTLPSDIERKREMKTNEVKNDVLFFTTQILLPLSIIHTYCTYIYHTYTYIYNIDPNGALLFFFVLALLSVCV
jgi:hypothetical protein